MLFSGKKEIWILLFILLVVFAVLSPVLSNDFLNWDDSFYVFKNPQIRVLDWEHVKTIFTSTVIKGYNPLTVLSFSIEHHFFGLNPVVFHLDNLLLHLAITALLFFLAMRMGLDVWAAGLGALLFGIHPMHVESVAWISERKDVLYSVFYVLAMHSYWSYLETKRKWPYALAVIWGLLSMLSKPMALSLPLILWVLDGMKGRKFSVQVMADKIPYFLYIVPILWVNYSSSYVQIEHSPFLESFLMMVWCSVFYLWKFLFPFVLNPIYSRVDPVSILNPAYWGAMVAVVLLIWAVIRFRKNRWFVFALIFYVCSLFFLFRLNALKINVVADRYMYLPSVGFCFLFGFLIRQSLILLEKKKVWQYVLAGCVGVLLLAASIKTFFQCRVWKDGETLFSEVIRQNPQHWFSLYNRARIYELQKKFDLALADYSQALSIKPDYGKAYNNRGALFLLLGREDEAFKDLNDSIRLAPELPEAYSNRAVIHLRRHQKELAVQDLQQALKLQPQLFNARLRLGNIYADMKQYDSAIEEYNRCLQVLPSTAKLYYFRSQAYAGLSQFEKALEDVVKAKELGYPNLETRIHELEQHVSSK